MEDKKQNIIMKIVRRIVVFPAMLVGSPLLYLVAYSFDGHRESWVYVKSLLSCVWNGEE